MAETDSASAMKHRIPFFFYDVIGRMMPGAYLILGAVLCWLPFIHWRRLVSFLNETRALGMSGGLATVVISTGVLFFALVSLFIGFLLAALSHTVVERWLWYRSRLNRSGLAEFLGIDNVDSLNARFMSRFGSMPTERSLNRSSFLCAYYIWRTDTTLGEMQGRFDSDLLASQSFVLVSGALTVAVLIESFACGFGIYFRTLFAILSAILLASCLAFNYHRKKRVYGRFGLFLAITDPLQAQREPHHQ